MQTTIYIKNMVCPRCIEAVKTILEKLSLPIEHIQLGEVCLAIDLNRVQQEALEKQLKEKGFELLQDSNVKLVHQIKTIIIEAIHHGKGDVSIKISSMLNDRLVYNYTSLSKIFSTVEGKTIERFTLMQRIERVKALLSYDELNLSEIAFQMGYSSTAHLSSQFKKEVGLSPSEYKKLENPARKPLDEICEVQNSITKNQNSITTLVCFLLTFTSEN